MNNILLGKGLDKISFGSTKESIQKLLGEPDEKEFIEGDEECGALEAWHYDTNHFSLSFEEDCNWRLVSITTSNTDFLFEGIDLIGLSQSEVMEQMNNLDLGDFELEDISTEEHPDQFIATNSDFSLNLFFDGDILSEIQWGPYWDDEDNCPIWIE